MTRQLDATHNRRVGAAAPASDRESEVTANPIVPALWQAGDG
jgi:hypothetical protein